MWLVLLGRFGEFCHFWKLGSSELLGRIRSQAQELVVQIQPLCLKTTGRFSIIYVFITVISLHKAYDP